MTKTDFLEEIKNDIVVLLSEYTLKNYKNQIFAWKLNATFNRKYNENYIWNRALFLTTNSCILLQNNVKDKIANEALYECAETYEFLGEISEVFDKDYLLVLSALCYDLSGYQANAYCIANKITDYHLSTNDSDIDLRVDNKILEQIKFILLKKIDFARSRLKDADLENDQGYLLFSKAMELWYSFVLKQLDTDYLSEIHKTYRYYLSSGNTYLSHLLFLLKTRISIFEERSIWKIIQQQEFSSNYQWKKYIRLLASDYYDNHNIRKQEDRKSIFEFWISQLRAIESGILSKDENFVVQMPTSTGKTFIAELLILKHLINSPEKKCIYIAPFRALTNEKESELGRYLGKLGYSVSSLSGSYEIDAFQDVVLSSTDLLIGTPEKIDMLLRINPDFFSNISFLVVDEGHIIGDFTTRASLLEFLIIRLRIKIPEIKTLFISAVMPIQNANEYSLWLSGKESNVLRSLKYTDSKADDEWEPTRKLISHFEWNGTKGNIIFKTIFTDDKSPQIKQGAILNGFLNEKEFGGQYPNKKDKGGTAAALAYKLSENGCTLVYCAQVRYTLSVAKKLLKIIACIELPNRFKENKNKPSSYYAKKWYGENDVITKAINYGIGIHYGDMPEQVRMAVEEDFRNELLLVLLSTNTIAQGLNFPIKNIVFYQTLINRNKNIQNRDFWNIVGRAGRAGKETEGRVVFIINSYTDRETYNNLTNKSYIENAESLLFKVLKSLIDKRIHTDDFSNFVSLLSETYLLDLITEELIGTEYKEIIEKIINNSLFRIQIDKGNYDITPLKNEFKRIFKSFEHKITYKELQIYKSTGLSFESNRQISEFIDNNFELLISFVSGDDYMNIVTFFFKLISNNVIIEMNNEKLDKLYYNQYKPSDFMDIVTKWVSGEPLAAIMDIWRNELKLDIEKLYDFLSQGLYYLYPWGLSAFIIFLSFKMEIEYKELPNNIRAVASYLKFGLNTETSCLARSLGIKDRQVSILLSEKTSYLNGNDFIRWLSNLTFEEIEAFDVSPFDKENILNVSLKLTPKNQSNFFLTNYNFTVKGTVFNNEWSVNSKSIIVGDKLNYQHEEYNKYDPFAILIFKNNHPIGYIPREYSKLISSEIDIEEKNYDIFVTKIDDKDKYNEITVRMSERLNVIW